MHDEIIELKMKNEKLNREVDCLQRLVVKKKPRLANKQTNSPFEFSGNLGSRGSARNEGVGSIGIAYDDYKKPIYNVFVKLISNKHSRQIKGEGNYKYKRP